MPFATQFLTDKGEWSCAVSYEVCDTRIEVLTYLLNTWCTLDVLHGTFAFLADYGYDFGVTDEDAGKIVGTAAHDAAKAAVLDLCREPEMLTEYLRAVEGRMRLTWR
jgi:hypothetical protein